jgi:phage terminase Nu1 subunit (DNA packaging protein)
MAIVGVGKVAQALNLSEQRVQQLVKEGLPREARGRYDVIACMLFYVRYLQRAIEKKSVPTPEAGSLGERDPRVRLLRAEADLREIALAKERANLMAVADVDKMLTDLVRTTTARIMAIPPRLASELMGETSRLMVQAKLDKAFKDVLAHLARSPVQP